MFGYVTLNPETLSEAEKARFREVYCGVCRSLGREYGAGGQLTLSYDAAFLALTLNALYEPEEMRGQARCKAHPAKKRAYAMSDMTRYAADMNLLLAYYRLLDGWQDDHSYAKLTASKLLKPRAEAVAHAYPEKAARMISSLDALAACEKAREMDIDTPANCFGTLVGELFALKDDNWRETLFRMGCALGRFVYLMDAWDDAKRDKKSGAFNPLIPLMGEADYEERIHGILTMQIAECAMEFEKLPIVSDAGLLRNVIYSGVWLKYARKRKLQERRMAND